MEAAHEIDNLRHALFAECIYSRLIRSLGQASTSVKGGGNVVGDRFVPGQIRRALSRDDGCDLGSWYTGAFYQVLMAIDRFVTSS